jgi:hypothetical protein
VDGSGYIYIADGFTAVIRKVTASTGIIAWLRGAWVGVFVINRPPTLFDLRLVVIEPFNLSGGLIDTGQKKQHR